MAKDFLIFINKKIDIIKITLSIIARGIKEDEKNKSFYKLWSA